MECKQQKKKKKYRGYKTRASDNETRSYQNKKEIKRNTIIYIK